MNYFIAYVIADLFTSLLVLAVLYSKRDLLKEILKDWLEVPTLPKVDEDDNYDVYPDEEVEYLGEDYV